MLRLVDTSKDLFQSTAAHEKRDAVVGCRIEVTLKRKITVGTGMDKDAFEFLVGNHLSGDATEHTLPGNSDFPGRMVKNDKLANLLNIDAISLHEKNSFQNTHISVI